MKTRAIKVLLPFTVFAMLFIHSTASGAKSGFCYRKIITDRGCRSIAGRKVTERECCLNIKGVGWSEKRINRRSCKLCGAWLNSSQWSEWTAFSPCPVTCGVGVKTRNRTCNKKYIDGPECQGSALDTMRCQGKRLYCPIDGGWTNWTSWSDCSVTCQQGVQIRKRTCTNPVPQHGGKMCKGIINESRKCTLRQHCPIDGGWGPWGPWSECSKSCDMGTQTRRRSCDNPRPQHGGKPCLKSESVDNGLCRIHKCSVVDGDGSGDSSGSGDNNGFIPESSGSGSGSGAGSGGGWTPIRKKRGIGFSDDEDY